MFKTTGRWIVDRILRLGLFYFFIQVTLSTSGPPQWSFVAVNVSASFQFEKASWTVLCQFNASFPCKNATLDYISPKSVIYGYLMYRNPDGCTAVMSIASSLDQDDPPCSHSVGPYEVIPNQPMTAATKCIHSTSAQYSSCNLTSALVKQPGQETWMPLTRLNKPYVNITIESPGYLYFRLLMPVPKLHDLMVVINFDCSKNYKNPAFGNFTRYKECIRAKVVGTMESTVLGRTLFFDDAILGLFYFIND